jgi:hypothetical protein
VVNQFVAAASRGAEPGGAHLDTSTTAARQTNRDAGFIRQAGEWDWGCRMNPAFRWWCQDAPSEAEQREHQVLLGRDCDIVKDYPDD